MSRLCAIVNPELGLRGHEVAFFKPRNDRSEFLHRVLDDLGGRHKSVDPPSDLSDGWDRIFENSLGIRHADILKKVLQGVSVRCELERTGRVSPEDTKRLVVVAVDENCVGL